MERVASGPITRKGDARYVGLSSSSRPSRSTVPKHIAQSRSSSLDRGVAKLTDEKSKSEQLIRPIPINNEKIDSITRLQRMDPTVVKTRTGSVLSRGFILKTDHAVTQGTFDLELSLHGAPNFRAPRLSSLNVFGVAQPYIGGIKAILSLLGCRPGPKQSTCIFFSTREEPIVYISGRPFVLRDASEPKKSLSLSDRAENLEGIERRLKADILNEAARFGGLILTHHELEGGETVVPTWTAVDAENVQTIREVWEGLKADGWNVEYHRIPISPDRPIEDNYLDAYVDIIKSTNPLETSLVFSCGMGAVRTTFSMVAACIIRRKQLMSQGVEDPFGKSSTSQRASISAPAGVQAAALEQAEALQEQNKSLLRLTFILQRCLEDRNPRSAIELLLMQPTLMDNLSRACRGNYSVILSLLGCIDHGIVMKQLCDRVIDSCDQVVNLREDILRQRLRYSTTTMDDKRRRGYLEKAVKAMDKYFFTIAFASYVDEHQNFEETFSSWMKARIEIWNQVLFMRRSKSLNVFAPVSDLSVIARSSGDARGTKENELSIAGGKVLGDELTDHVVKNRTGIILRSSTLLKSDQWRKESRQVAHGVRGAINFRRIPSTSIYCLGQPTIDAITDVLAYVKESSPHAERIVWINLREEPVVYINGAPYCLRRENYSLRNMKDYGGISSSRLEMLEDRLKNDVIAELHSFGDQILLHTESTDGSVVPVWEEASAKDVAVLRDVMSSKRLESEGMELQFSRIPITSERPPDFSDISDLLDVVIRTGSALTPIVLNCQLGRGRSTTTAVIVLLIQQWVKTNQARGRSHSRRPTISTVSDLHSTWERTPARHSYQVINNLLRVIRNGLQVKEAVDAAIDKCGELYNLHDQIEKARKAAEESQDRDERKRLAQKGLQNLRRYFELIIFQAYLRSTQPDTIRSYETFEAFVKDRPVFKTFEKELHLQNENPLKPLERIDVTQNVALPDEVQQIVAKRSGGILSAFTILKSDFFSNLQKMSLPERIEGAPNFRQVPLTLNVLSYDSDSTEPAEASPNGAQRLRWIQDGKTVCGSGMPTLDGLRRTLARVNALPEGGEKVFWTSLREEPVLYVAGRPHVLRLIDKPLQNVEATGVTTDIVEAMENNMKKDLQDEVQANMGKILLHDELEDPPGVYTITPQFETISEKDIMTPREMFDLMIAEGYKVDYARVAITDEQAPLPAALNELVERVEAGLEDSGTTWIFNCQMGRGRTTTGMIAASLISTIRSHDIEELSIEDLESDSADLPFDKIDGSYEEQAYLNGEYKIILQLVSVLSYGKVAKQLTDRAVDAMDDVQNLRRAIFNYKLQVDASEKGSAKHRKAMDMGVNYLYRYGTLIVLANYLIARHRSPNKTTFQEWLTERREIKTLLERRSLD